MTTKDVAINRILTLMELSARLQTESFAKSDASFHASEQAGRLADAIGLNWDIDVEPLLDERYAADVIADVAITEPSGNCANTDTIGMAKSTQFLTTRIEKSVYGNR